MCVLVAFERYEVHLKFTAAAAGRFAIAIRSEIVNQIKHTVQLAPT